jgi:hypothetical protein
MLYTAFVLFSRIQQHAKLSAAQSESKSRSRIGIFFFLSLIALVCVELSRSDVITSHPIDNLIFNANVQHNRWTKQATESRSLEDAVARYRERYNTYPPP